MSLVSGVQSRRIILRSNNHHREVCACYRKGVFSMTRGTIIKDFFKNTVLTVVIAYLLFTWGKILFIHDGQGEYFYVALFCGVPFGIRRMFLWLVPFGHDITFTIGIFAVNIIIGGIIGIFVLAWKLIVAAWYIPLTIYRLVTAGNRNDIDIY